jgi:ParB-like chromosome segregation protein Spo0J
MNAVVEMRKVDSLRYDPNNVRLHTDRNLEAVKASYDRFGQQRPILISEDGIVVAGNCQLAAARDLGWEEIQVQVTSLKDASEIKAYAIADNRTNEFGEWDLKGLSSQLEELKEIDFDFDSVGFDEKEINKIFDNVVDVEVPEVNDPDIKEEKKEKLDVYEHSGSSIQLTIKENADAEEIKQAIGMINAVVMQFPKVFNEKSANIGGK